MDSKNQKNTSKAISISALKPGDKFKVTQTFDNWTSRHTYEFVKRIKGGFKSPYGQEKLDAYTYRCLGVKNAQIKTASKYMNVIKIK